jgi:HK97 gp10 family phage protein
MKVKVEGLSETLEALRQLPKATSRNVLRRALIKAASPIEQQAEQSAPVRTAKLKVSITAGTALSKRERTKQRRWEGSVPVMTVAGWRSEPKTAVYVFVGAGPLPQARMQEYGTVNHGPQPYMRPAWDANKMKALTTIKADIWHEIDKARARLARKAERIAARIKSTA